MADRRALVITTPGVIGLHEAAELIPGPGEVVARPVHTGICGTDLELVAGVGDGTLALITAHLVRLYSPAELIVPADRRCG